MFKRERPGYISLTIEVPIEVAEFFGDHGDQLLSSIRRAVAEYKANPPDPDGQIETEGKRRQEERARKFKADGRLGYRLLRPKIGTETYISPDGGIRNRGGLSRAAWKRVILSDIASEHGLEAGYLGIAVRQFRKDIHSRIKARREAWAIRYHLAGLTDTEIAYRLGVSHQTIWKYLKAAQPEIFRILRENPDIRAEMRVLVGTPVRKAPRAKAPAQPSRAARRQK